MSIIQTPCHADWNEMQLVSGGRYCASCSHVVQDFSDKTHQEIIQWLQTKTSERACGQISEAQWTFSKPRTYSNDWKSFLLALVLVFFSAGSIWAKPVPVAQKNSVSIVENGSPYQSTLTGTVLDKSKKPLKNVTIQVYRGNKKIGETTTSKTGVYTLQVPLEVKSEELTVYFDSDWGEAEQKVTLTHAATINLDAVLKVIQKKGKMCVPQNSNIEKN